jgi:DNA-cytosine methyltransferase
MNVLSLFDGISCAYEALLKAKKPIGTYYSSEIDKNAIKVSTQNHPDIVRLGDVKEITVANLPAIDLLIGGSPCQDLSIAKKGREGLEGDRSSLFWEYVRLKNELNPKYFIFENVASMPLKDKEIITEALGVQPVLFNASLVSAQSRKRLFWTNIKFDLPDDKGIILNDILEPNVETNCRTNHTLTATTEKAEKARKKNSFVQLGYIGSSNASNVGGQALRVYDTNAKSTTSGVGLYQIGHIGTTNGQANRVYDPKGKSVCLSANGGGSGAKTGLYRIQGISKPIVLNDSSLQVLKEGRTELGKQSRKETREQTGKDTTSRSAGHKAYFGRDGVKANCLTTSLGAEGHIVKDGIIRKLTPIECERLMGLPDNYTQSVAMTNRYKCLGNAFHVDVVAHILESIK